MPDYRLARASGGHKWHVVDADWKTSPGDRRRPALCGYRPGGVTRMGQRRARWAITTLTHATISRKGMADHALCDKCMEKLDEPS